MRKALTAPVLALACLGCGGSGGGTPLDGNWDVIAIDGKPVQPGLIMVVHYERGGEFQIATIGSHPGLKTLKRDAIQPAMDRLPTVIKTPTLALKGDGLDLELKKSETPKFP